MNKYKSKAKPKHNFALYYRPTCPYSRKVLEAISNLDVDVALRNISDESKFSRELKKGGGRVQVPCLLIDGARWMYESDDIIEFLQQVTE